MKRLKLITTLFFALLMLFETMGVQLIKDMCMPCHETTVTVQIPFTAHNDACEHHHHKAECKGKHSNSCDSENHREHKHRTEAAYIQISPDFFESNPTFDFHVSPQLIAIFERGSSLLPTQKTQHCSKRNIFHKLPSNDEQSLLCIFII